MSFLVVKNSIIFSFNFFVNKYMEIGRLYSRVCGWENGAPVKSYNTSLISIFPKDVCDIDGKTGSFIVKYMDKN
jgi:hypothetical protein